MNDHVIKAREGRGRWATGSQHKISGLDGAAYALELMTPLHPGGQGRARLTISKDRPGGARNHSQRGDKGVYWAGDLVVASSTDGRLTASIEPPVGEMAALRPTLIMRRVSDLLEATNEPLSQRAIVAGVPAKAVTVRTAIEYLVAEGYVEIEKGAHRAKLHRFAVPFREPTE